jgi:hypothetical protein
VSLIGRQSPHERAHGHQGDEFFVQIHGFENVRLGCKSEMPVSAGCRAPLSGISRLYPKDSFTVLRVVRRG